MEVGSWDLFEIIWLNSSICGLNSIWFWSIRMNYQAIKKQRNDLLGCAWRIPFSWWTRFSFFAERYSIYQVFDLFVWDVVHKWTYGQELHQPTQWTNQQSKQSKLSSASSVRTVRGDWLVVNTYWTAKLVRAVPIADKWHLWAICVMV